MSRGAWNNHAFLTESIKGILVLGVFFNHEEFYPNHPDVRKTSKRVIDFIIKRI